MNKILFLPSMLVLILLCTCAGSEESNCSVSGCDDGFHCTTEGNCEEDCIDAHCETMDLSCNHDTGLCENIPCTETGCNDSFICNDETMECEAACILNTCDDHYLCDENLGTCYPSCTETGCQVDYICDEASQLCIPDANCIITGCEPDYICDEASQLCIPDTSCNTTGCEPDYSCNTNTGLCEHIDCTYNSCTSDLICNVYNGFCEAATEYPTGVDVVANRTWTDQNGKTVSFMLLYNRYIKTGYPKAIYLGHSAGWCPYCRAETPHVQAKYASSQTGNYYKLAVLQELCEDDYHQPATPTFISGWVSQYNLTYSVAIGDQIHSFRSGVHPVSVIIDPSTMKLVIVADPRDYGLTEADTVRFLNDYIDPLYSAN
jgi:hypothetical protein